MVGTSAGSGIPNFSGTPGAFTALGLPDIASANAINAGGEVVGTDGMGGSFLLSGGTLQTLPSVNGTTANESALGINDSGIIVGEYADNGSPASSLGFIDTQGVFTTLNPNGLSAVTFAQGINNNGLVVGFYGTAADPATTHGFLFDSVTDVYNTALPDPSTPQTANDNLAFTQFLGINDSGEAVGYYGTKDTKSQFGFLFNTNTGTYTYLDDPQAAPFMGTQVTQITGITNSGEIAGFYTNADNATLGFVATPAAVPEASSLVSLSLLLALGVGGVYAAKKRNVAA